MTGYRYMPISASMYPTPKDTYVDDFNENLIEDFATASDVWDILEETTRGLGVCDKSIQVRINHLVDPAIGVNLDDDYKKLLFGTQKTVTLGSYWYFDNNYWITINTGNIKSLSSSCAIKRCNQMLRWTDSTGAIYQYPCSISYKISGSQDRISRSGDFPIGQGMISVIVQNNAITTTIQPNQRFLFGNPSNWVAYRITGGGILNYNNLQTTSSTSYGTLELQMEFTAENSENDDFVNGIANADKYDYVITLNPSSFSGVVGNTITLIPTVKLNGEVVTRSVTWSSATPTKATVGATTGLVTLIATGTSVITCTMANNSSVHASATITVAASAPADTYSVRISPATNSLYLLDTQTYTVNLYKNGTITADTFTFAVDATNTAPTSSYDFTALSGNTFNVENLAMSIGKPLVILATSVTSPTHTQLFSINLQGNY
jgi:hypothetical protein